MGTNLETQIAQLRGQYYVEVKKLQNLYRSQYYRILRLNMNYKQKQRYINNLRTYYRNQLNKLRAELDFNIRQLQNAAQAAEATQAARAGKKTALIIACNYRGTDNELNGCINDANNIRNKLNSQYKFDAITMLTDDTAQKSTQANIVNELRNMLTTAQAGDQLFVSFSGHGTYMKDTSGDEKDGKDEMFVPLDMKCIRDDEMKDFIQHHLKKDVKLVMLFDCCHSGSMLDLKYQHLDSTAVNKTTVTNNSETKGDVFMISGCMDSQTSADAYLSGKYQGAMTYALLKVLNATPNTTWWSLIINMRRFLKTSRFQQIPQLSSGRSLDLNSRVCL